MNRGRKQTRIGWAFIYDVSIDDITWLKSKVRRGKKLGNPKMSLDVIYGQLREGGWKGNHAMPETNKAPFLFFTLYPLVTSSYKRCLVFPSLSPYAEVGEHTCSLNRISSFTLEFPYSSEKNFFGK